MNIMDARSKGPLSPDLIWFGPFRLSVTERALEKEGVRVRLGSRALDILIALVERPAEVVTKKELFARVWPDLVVDEGNLRYQVSALRKALGEGRSDTRYVTNVSGRGYCFVRPISRAASPPALLNNSLAHSPAGLPPSPTGMEGRDETVQLISEELMARRFLTIVGPGGIGTALARHSHQSGPSEARFANVYEAEAIAAIAVRCLLRELETWPKPGLVSHVDSGSHSDMNFGTFQRSVAAIKPYLHALTEAGAKGRGMGRLRIIGLEAEAAMFAATGGINTHRGAIFGLGLLCAAAGAKVGGLADPTMPLGDVVVRLWGRNILDGPVQLHSHGGEARRHYGAGGARAEAAQGFLSVYEVGLPALQWGALIAPGDTEAARVQACFALIASLEDTNLLHRGGMSGLRYAQCAARVFLDDGGVGTRNWRERANVVHQSFVTRRLSPGGSADLLAMTLFIQACEAEFFSCRR